MSPSGKSVAQRSLKQHFTYEGTKDCLLPEEDDMSCRMPRHSEHVQIEPPNGNVAVWDHCPQGTGDVEPNGRTD